MPKKIITLILTTVLLAGLTGFAAAQEMAFSVMEIPVVPLVAIGQPSPNGDIIAAYEMEIPIEAQLATAHLSPNGDVIAAYESAEINNFEPLPRYLWLIDAATGETLTTFSEPTDYTSAVAFNADGTTMASLHTNGDIFLWDMSTATLRQQFNVGLYNGGRFAQFLPDNRTLAVLHQAQISQIVLLDTETGFITRTLSPRFETQQAFREAMTDVFAQISYRYVAATLAPDGASIAVANGNDGVLVWEIASQNQITLKPESENKAMLNITMLMYSADGGQLAYNHPREGSLTLLDADTGTPEAVLEITADAFALSPDGEQIAWVNREAGAVYFAPLDAIDQPTTLLELPEGLRVAPRLTTLQFSPDGRALLLSGLFGEDDSTIYKFTLGE